MHDTDLEDVVSTVRDLIRDRVIPHEADIDASDEMPAGLREEAAQMGLFGFAIPEEYGGLGLSMAQETRPVACSGWQGPPSRSTRGGTTARPSAGTAGSGARPNWLTCCRDWSSRPAPTLT